MAGTLISDALETTPVGADMIPFARTADAIARHTTVAELGDLITETICLGTANKRTMDANISGAIDTEGLAFIEVDTFDGEATGDLETINGGAEGDILIIAAFNGSRTVVVKHNTGNIWLRDEIDISLTTRRLYILLIRAYNSMWYQFL